MAIVYICTCQMDEKCRVQVGPALSRTVVKPDSHLAQIFVAKFLCIIKFIIIIG